MIITITNNQPFQATNTEFSFTVTDGGTYTLYMSANGVDYTPYSEPITAPDTVVVSGVVPDMFFKIDGIQGQLTVLI